MPSGWPRRFKELCITDTLVCPHRWLAELAAHLAGMPLWADVIAEALVVYPGTLKEIIMLLVEWHEAIQDNDNQVLSSLSATLGQMERGAHAAHIAEAMRAASRIAVIPHANSDLGRPAARVRTPAGSTGCRGADGGSRATPHPCPPRC